MKIKAGRVYERADGSQSNVIRHTRIKTLVDKFPFTDKVGDFDVYYSSGGTAFIEAEGFSRVFKFDLSQEVFSKINLNSNEIYLTQSGDFVQIGAKYNSLKEVFGPLFQATNKKREFLLFTQQGFCINSEIKLERKATNTEIFHFLKEMALTPGAKRV